MSPPFPFCPLAARIALVCAAILALHPACVRDGATPTSPADGGSSEPVNARIGAACATNDDCGGLLCLPAIDPSTNQPTGFAGGYCTETDCATGQTHCPTGSHCFGSTSGVCLADCSSAAPCRSGYACVPTATGGACVPACRSDADCPGEVCVASTGLCAADVRRVRVGAACTADGDCGSGGLCLTAADGYPDGYCTGSPCDPAAAEAAATCPGGSSCVGGGSGGSLCLASCRADADCRPGYDCVAGHCLPRCRADADCPSAHVCDAPSGRCVPDLRQARNVGGACTEAGEESDCGPGGACIPETQGGQPTGYAGGYCIGLSCDPGVAGRDCPAGARCFGSGLDALCLEGCDPSASTCRAGYVCISTGYCVPACRTSADCDPTGTERLACDSASGRCVPRFDDVPVGDACASDGACGTHGTCIAQEPSGQFSGGYCTALPCGSASPCPAGSVCSASGGTPLCMRSCTQDPDCRAGYVCTGALCVPACGTNADCGATFACDTASGRCVPTFGDVPVGASCTSDAACGTHGSCFTDAQGYPGGYCSAVGCSSTSPCPAGSTCHTASGSSLCLADCSATSPCRASYHCDQLTSGDACLP